MTLVSIMVSKDKVISTDTIIYERQNLLSLTCKKYQNEPDETALIGWILMAGVVVGFCIFADNYKKSYR